MTRETRIGLLVGLVFIVLFGLVISGLTGSSSAPVSGPPAIEPERPLVVLSDPHRRGGIPEAVVVSPTPILRERQDGTVDVRVDAHGPSGSNRLAAIETLVARPSAPVGVPGGTRDDAVTVPVETLRPDAPSVPLIVPAPRVRTYVVQQGDSLIRIAAKEYGEERKMEYKRIFEANRDKLTSESTVVVGQELIIPPLPGTLPPVTGPGGPSESAPRPRPSPAPARTPAGGVRLVTFDEVEGALRDYPAAGTATRTYVVRRGDSLTSIARREMRDDSPAAVRKLYEANRDKLDSPDSLPAGVELVIPRG